MSEGNSFFGFLEEDLVRLRRLAPLQYVEFHPELTSTNDLAIDLSAQDDVPLPLLILAERQLAGRGQRERQWWSSPGALTFSLVVSTEQMQLPTELWPKVSLTTGLAVCESLEGFLPEEQVQIKWPNDVFVQGKKICGILVESPSVQRGQLVIGIGINVNNSVTDAPDELAEIATTMVDLKGDPTPLVEVLVSVVEHLVDRLQWIGTRDDQLQDRWRSRSLLTGRSVTVETVTGILHGVCRGIDGDGALLLQTEQGVRPCLAGTVTLAED